MTQDEYFMLFQQRLNELKTYQYAKPAVEYCEKNDIFSIENGVLAWLILEAYCIEKVKDFCFDKSNIFGVILYLINQCSNVEKEQTAEDVIPDHYTRLKVEPINFIKEEKLTFSCGNIVKYLSRLGAKDSRAEELGKIFFYFDIIINNNYNFTKQTFRK